MWQMSTADTHLKTINWIFMWIIAGAGFVELVGQDWKTGGLYALPIYLDNQFMFPIIRFTLMEAIHRLFPLPADSIIRKYANTVV